MKRSAGILLPISSLPSKYGIGCFDKAAYAFVDFLKDAGQTCWQILPLGQTSYGDSPYQSFSTFAGNPYFISLDALCDEQLLKKEECEAAALPDTDCIDHSRLYETLQYPFSYLSGDEEIELVEKCRQLDVGFIAMKAMGGGLIKNSKASFAFLNQFDNVLPIWGIQKLEELNEFLSYDDNTILTDELKADIEKDKKELGENFCRGCGYCMPCPEEINVSLCARMSLWIRRFPTEPNMDERTQEIMKKTLDCVECYECVDKCPYELDIPELLKENYEDYLKVLNGEIKL